MNKLSRIKITVILFAPALAFITGCGINSAPRPRLGSYATATPGTYFRDLDVLGRHNYDNFFFEGNGIVYTCRGGHIDITHLRISADYTKYLTTEMRNNMAAGKTEFDFKLNVEPSIYHARLEYPANWDSLPQADKDAVIERAGASLGQYLAFTMTTWHEILTWYGYKCMGILPEDPSAFSWEDIYSNLLGIRLGAKAMDDKDKNYNQAMTDALKEEMEQLGIISGKKAKQAAAKMSGKWYKGVLLVEMKQRNMDTGRDDGYVTPILVPELADCPDAAAQSYPAPTLEIFNSCGFKLELKVQPKEFEKNKILKHVYPDGKGKYISIPEQMNIILDAVKAEAESQGFATMPYGG